MNPYNEHLKILFHRILELRHVANHLNSVLTESIKRFDSVKDTDFIVLSSLVISDWTGPTDNGWEVNFHTGINKVVFKHNYDLEVKRIISQECCFAYAQSFEALERFLKNCIKIKGIDSEKSKPKIRRDELFEQIKKVCNPTFNMTSGKNNKKIKFKEYWVVLYKVRDAIIHSTAAIEKKEIELSADHKALFEYLFSYSEIDSEKIRIELDYRELDKLLKNVSEFAFLVYKQLSINEKLDWNFYY